MPSRVRLSTYKDDDRIYVLLTDTDTLDSVSFRLTPEAAVIFANNLLKLSAEKIFKDEPHRE